MGIHRIVKPAKCDAMVVFDAWYWSDILHRPANVHGHMVINDTGYDLEQLGHVEAGEPVIDGYRLTKPNGEAHDICLVAGRLECTCGDYEFRRSQQLDRDLADCKHTKAVREHLALPNDQYQPPVIDYAVAFDDP